MTRALILLALLLSSCFSLVKQAQAQECQIKAVIFDYGGVIADVDRSEIVSFVMKTFDVSREEAAKLLKESRPFRLKGEADEESYWKQVAKEHRVELKDGWSRPFDYVLLESIKEIPGTLPVIQELKENGIRVGILSNIDAIAAKYVRQKGHYEGYTPLLLSFEMGVEKPNPQAYEKMIETLNLSPHEIFFIDDRIENVEAAKKLGIVAYHFDNAAALKREMTRLHILKEKRLTFDKHSIWYETLGDPKGEPLILISGATTVGRYWSDSFCIDLVKRGYFVTRFDHRDIGGSSAHPEDYSVHHMADDVVGIMKALKIEKAHLIGHSMGGYIAQMTAVRYPQRVKSLTVVSAGPIGHTEKTAVPFTDEELELIDRTCKFLQTERPDGPVEEVLRQYEATQKYMAGDYEVDSDLIARYVEDLASRSCHTHKHSLKHVSMMTKFMDEMHNWTPSMKKISCPVLVIQGGKDPIIPAHRGGLALYEAVPHSELLFLPKMGHMLFNKELQDTVAERFDQFTKAHKAPCNTRQSNSLDANS